MPSIKKLREDVLHPIGETTMFLKPMTLEQIEKLQTFSDMEDPTNELFLYLFNNFIVDENGDKYDDAQTKEDVKKNLDFRLGVEIMEFFSGHFNVNLQKEPN